jgi:hypothetical protein
VIIVAKVKKVLHSFRLSLSLITVLKDFANRKHLSLAETVEMACWWFFSAAEKDSTLLTIPKYEQPTFEEKDNGAVSPLPQNEAKAKPVAIIPNNPPHIELSLDGIPSKGITAELKLDDEPAIEQTEELVL